MFVYMYPASHFLRMRVKGIMETTKRSRDRKCHWKMPLLMKTLPRLFPYDVSSLCQPFMESFSNVVIF